ncbi:hypothetical protein EGP64_00185 [bacterium]|nr:hypothetical protein [bacterium]
MQERNERIMKKIILGFILGGIVFTLGGVVATTAISSTNVTYQNKTVNSALDELYDEATTGKELVAAAITNKGVSTTSNDSYETMATNINNIDTDHSELIQKISSLESKHTSDISSINGTLSNINQNLIKVDTIDLSMTTGTDTGGAWYYTKYTLDLSKYNNIIAIIPTIIRVGTGINIPQTVGIEGGTASIYYQSTHPGITANIRVTVIYS